MTNWIMFRGRRECGGDAVEFLNTNVSNVSLHEFYTAKFIDKNVWSFANSFFGRSPDSNRLATSKRLKGSTETEFID